jgi:hypothetical protein
VWLIEDQKAACVTTFPPLVVSRKQNLAVRPRIKQPGDYAWPERNPGSYHLRIVPTPPDPRISYLDRCTATKRLSIRLPQMISTERSCSGVRDAKVHGMRQSNRRKSTGNTTKDHVAHLNQKQSIA